MPALFWSLAMLITFSSFDAFRLCCFALCLQPLLVSRKSMIALRCRALKSSSLHHARGVVCCSRTN